MSYIDDLEEMTQQRFIVGIGSSAGGLQALMTFFDFTPHDSATYILLRHTPREYQSCLIDIMKKHSKLEFIEAANAMPLAKDKVYFPPTGMHMTITNDTLYLQKRSLSALYPNHAVDIFFNSLALDKGSNGIAVVLSGTGSDGTRGITAVKNAGGMTIAQEPESCGYPQMPRNAINTGNIDHILRPPDMPRHILKYITKRLST